MNKRIFLLFCVIIVVAFVAYCSIGCAAVDTSSTQQASTGGAIVNTEAPTNVYDFALDLIKWIVKWTIASVIIFWVIKAWIDGNLNPIKAKYKKG